MTWQNRTWIKATRYLTTTYGNAIKMKSFVLAYYSIQKYILPRQIRLKNNWIIVIFETKS